MERNLMVEVSLHILESHGISLGLAACGLGILLNLKGTWKNFNFLLS